MRKVADFCSIDGCGRAYHANGYCGPHNHRNARHGSPMAGGYVREHDPIRRIERFVSVEGDCWIWTGTLRAGYGQASSGGGVVLNAHRVVYELLVGPIPDGLVLDHLCRVKACVNPDHVEPVTQAENLRRARKAS